MEKEKLQAPPIYNSISPITHTWKIANINNYIITLILIANHYKRSLKSCLKKKGKDLMTVGFQYKLMGQKTMESQFQPERPLLFKKCKAKFKN